MLSMEILTKFSRAQDTSRIGKLQAITLAARSHAVRIPWANIETDCRVLADSIISLVLFEQVDHMVGS